jgi:hypothetical protein
MYYGWMAWHLGAYGFLSFQNEDFENISKSALPLFDHTKMSTYLSLLPRNIQRPKDLVLFYKCKNEIALKINTYIYIKGRLNIYGLERKHDVFTIIQI